MNLWKSEPVMTAQVAGALASLGAAFGLHLTGEQVIAVFTVVQLVAGLIGRSQVSPVAK